MPSTPTGAGPMESDDDDDDHRSVAYSVELVLLNKHQVYGGAPKLH